MEPELEAPCSILSLWQSDDQSKKERNLQAIVLQEINEEKKNTNPKEKKTKMHEKDR